MIDTNLDRPSMDLDPIASTPSKIFPPSKVKDHLQSKWLFLNQKNVKGKAFNKREDW
jgi:hypothetical protein